MKTQQKRFSNSQKKNTDDERKNLNGNGNGKKATHYIDKIHQTSSMFVVIVCEFECTSFGCDWAGLGWAVCAFLT